ncbi:MAG: LPS-assembly protein LptD [Bacteroidaceae bacterium]|nr:LPS-assembly protein LptD [Bacteroidaceae bacterium]
MNKRIYILFIILLACVSMTQAGGSLSPIYVAADTIPDDSLHIARPDSLFPHEADSAHMQVLDSAAIGHLTALDSLRLQFDREHGIGRNPREQTRPRITQWNDSIAAAEDSISKTQRKSALEDPVVYEASDSIVFFLNSKDAYLYGSAKVDYQNLQLTADYISMNMDSSIVHATYAEDSIGKKIGRPVFKQSNDEYLLDSISYNFETRKGFMHNIYTEQQDGLIVSDEAKKGQGDESFLYRGKYTTCDEEHPHFYIRMSRAKVHTGKSVFFGPAWLVVEDVPLPVVVPFGFFPFTHKYQSGFIMPSYGDESSRGFYLRDGGYYFAFNDHVDMRLTGEIFTKGSWGIGLQTTYRTRYKYSGNFYFNYQVTKTGEKNMPDYSVVKNFKVQWSHRQDSKANPNSSFSASVNFATQSYERNNLSSLYNPTSYSQSTRTSSVSYSHTFDKIGLSLSSSFNISQNMRDSTIALTLPNLSLSLSRFYPFKRKRAAGKERWYEKIAMTYSGTLSNSISTQEDMILHSDLIKDWRNGMRHNIPISASFNIMKYINVTPSFNYTERWYSNRVEQHWNTAKQAVERDTIWGFNRVYNYNMSLSATTRLYGFYTPNPKIWGKKIVKVRHVFTPTVSFSYAPDFGASRYGFWKTYTKTDLDGNVSLVEYSPYSNSLYGTVSRGKTGSITFDMSNNIEMKVRGSDDSLRKVPIIDELGASLSYNMSAKTQPWSNLSTRLRLKFGRTTFNLNAVFATYAYEFNENGNVVVGNRTEWSYGRFGRFQGMSKNVSYAFNNQSWRKIKKFFDKLLHKGKADDDDPDAEKPKTEENADGQSKGTKGDELDEYGYMKFSIPWSFSISYGITMAEDRSAKINVKSMRYPYKLTQNLNFSGTIRLSSSWNASFSSGYDFNEHGISMTSVNIGRDMHCFNLTCGFVFGTFTSYHITLRATAATLTDALKYDKKSSYSSAIQWY